MVQQKPEEGLEEYAAYCYQLATDAWGDISPEVVDHAAVDAFLHGTVNLDAALSAMEQNPQSTYDAFEYLRQAMHNYKSLLSSRNRKKSV